MRDLSNSFGNEFFPLPREIFPFDHFAREGRK